MRRLVRAYGRRARMRWRAVFACSVLAIGTACLPGGFLDDVCSMRPVSHRWSLGAIVGPAVVAAASCGYLVEVNGARYAVGGPGEGLVVDEDELTPFGAVTASNSEVRGDVFALDGVDPAKLLVLHDASADGLVRPLYGASGEGEVGGAGQAFPEACRYFPRRTDDRCD